MKRQVAGISKALTVLAAAPVNPGDGTDLSQFAVNGYKPSNFVAHIRLAGGVTAQYVVYVRDASGWSIPLDVGNAGLVGGGDVATGHSYVLAINGIGAFLEVALVTQNLNGVVVTDQATLTEVKEF